MLSSAYKDTMKAVPSGTQLNRQAFSDGLNRGLDDLKADSFGAATRLKILATAMQIILFSAWERNEQAYLFESSCLAKVNSLNCVFSSMGLSLFSCDQIVNDYEDEVAGAIQELSVR